MNRVKRFKLRRLFLVDEFLDFDDKKTWLTRGSWLNLQGMQYCLFKVEVTEPNH